MKIKLVNIYKIVRTPPFGSLEALYKCLLITFLIKKYIMPVSSKVTKTFWNIHILKISNICHKSAHEVKALLNHRGNWGQKSARISKNLKSDIIFLKMKPNWGNKTSFQMEATTRPHGIGPHNLTHMEPARVGEMLKAVQKTTWVESWIVTKSSMEEVRHMAASWKIRIWVSEKTFQQGKVWMQAES